MIITLLLNVLTVTHPSLAHAESSSIMKSPIKFYEDNPTYIDPIDDSSSWKFSTPEESGLNSALLDKATDDLQKKPHLWSFLIVKDGKLAYEKYFNGSHARAANNVHSASKSILSAAIGIAVKKGYIESVDQKLSTLLPDYFKGVDNPLKKNISVRHLLTMQSGFTWTEDETEYDIEKEADWGRAILGLELEKKPGEKFLYNTGLTHLMSILLTETSGMSTQDFVHKFLFDKIGIHAKHWGQDKKGYYSGGYNLYLTPRELAKFGQLYLQEGKWRGKQIISKKWVADSTQKQVNAREGVDYGYNWWIRKIGNHDISFAWGFGGQFVYLVRDLNMVVVLTTNTKEYEPDFDADYLLKQYVLPAAE